MHCSEFDMAAAAKLAQPELPQYEPRFFATTVPKDGMRLVDRTLFNSDIANTTNDVRRARRNKLLMDLVALAAQHQPFYDADTLNALLTYCIA